MQSTIVRALTAGLLLLTTPLFVVNCSGGDDTGSGATGGTTSGGGCVGGIVIDGECRAKCSPDKCIQPPEGETWRNTCVENTCKLVCDAHSDCFLDGTQDCAAKTEDDTTAAVNVCVANGKASGFGNSCPFGNECDTQLACPNGRPCGASNCGGDAAACKKDSVACFGVENCTLGVCDAAGQPYHGKPCSLEPACPDNECKPMTCLTSGELDADAYCGKHDCSTDADCPGGFWCGVTMDPHGICNSMPAKGDNNHCGTTADPCIDPANFGTDGATYFEGSLCILRRTCMKREACAPCETDLDCSRVDNQRCVQVGPAKNCAVNCNTDSDCEDDFTCQANSCVPRFGACKGQGNFCEPCLSDDDCGGVGTTMACIQGSGNQKACFDLSFPDACTTNADCPAAPGGKHGTCLDENFGVGPGDSVYHRCYLPINLSTNKTGCW